MSEALKITASHLARVAIVYLRQSSTAQVEHNRESTDRQYALVNKASDLGWPTDKIVVIDRPSDRQRKSRKKKMVYIYMFGASTKREREKNEGKGEKKLYLYYRHRASQKKRWKSFLVSGACCYVIIDENEVRLRPSLLTPSFLFFKNKHPGSCG